MGGNALSFETRRVHADEYMHLGSVIMSKANGIFPKSSIRLIKSYHSKPDHGDIDVLISSNDVQDIKQAIQDAFNPREIVHNSNCYSFDYCDVQVDFIFMKEDDMDIASAYFAYNDLGNLIGRIYHKMGLKFGHDGLTLQIMAETRVIGKICLSKDIKTILEFGGYSHDRWLQGFENLQEIFDYVISSKYYAYEIFDLDNRNYRARVRDKKRKTYTEFLKFAEPRDQSRDYHWMHSVAYLPQILLHFDVVDEFFQIIDAYRRSEYVRQVFNGDIVMRLIPHLSGKDLSRFMAGFVNEYPKSHLESCSSEDVQTMILNYARQAGEL